MKGFRRALVVAAIVGGVVAMVGGPAGADPLRSKNALVGQAFCPSGTVVFVVNGNGEFTPAHVLDSTAVFVPTALDVTATGEFGGEPFSDHDTGAKANASPRPTETCDIVGHADFPGGFVDISGTATGFFTPAR
jgi:hypothetical protein